MINPDQLRDLRTLRGLSQRRLAKLAGLGPLGIKRLEDGADASNLSLKIVSRIAAALDVPIAQLLDSTPRQAAPEPAPAAAPPAPLDVNQARLLRRLHRGEDVRRHLSNVDRELTLPSLLRAGLARHAHHHLALRSDVTDSLALAPGPAEPVAECAHPQNGRTRA